MNIVELNQNEVSAVNGAFFQGIGNFAGYALGTVIGVGALVMGADRHANAWYNKAGWGVAVLGIACVTATTLSGIGYAIDKKLGLQ